MNKTQSSNTHGDLHESIQAQNGDWGVKWFRMYWPTDSTAKTLDEILTGKEIGISGVPLIVLLGNEHLDVAVREDHCRAFENYFQDRMQPRLCENDPFVKIKGSVKALEHTRDRFIIARNNKLWDGQAAYLDEEIERLGGCIRNSQWYGNRLMTSKMTWIGMI
ncbi:hypothetical protein LOZ66_006747 [Ophidiomyces ophidiicola]|nr:hypothetical protein LOZ66_006747 [Ophidiomyces ophidiicola]